MLVVGISHDDRRCRCDLPIVAEPFGVYLILVVPYCEPQAAA
jgi:hypothetical protein